MTKLTAERTKCDVGDYESQETVKHAFEQLRVGRFECV